MCRDCGCSDPSRLEELAHVHEHAHDHDHAHEHHHDHQHTDARAHERAHRASRTLTIGRSLVELNDHLAMHNRERFRSEGVFVVNLMSSPGAGKTRLLERTLDDLAGTLRMAVITGDLQTDNDARRLAGRGARVVPVTTGTMCHLEADAVNRACADLDLATIDVLFIENVGNLVCPASFDLGEKVRVVLMSVTEGDDKPLKYPPIFKLADVVLVTKTDLAEPAEFDRISALENISRVAPQAAVIEVSARTGSGLNQWYKFLTQHVPALLDTKQAVAEAAST
jgi:hydrogenase nickel incorporation protein HypB